jgi:hypothetical protein
VDAELLLKSKSVSLLVTVAVLLIWPGADGVTTMVMIELAPTARLPTLQFTVLVPLQLPCVAFDDTKETPAGSVSDTLTLVAAAGPLLVAVMRYERFTPISPGLGEAVFVTKRSALVALTTLRLTDVLCIVEPLCALTLIVWFPKEVPTVVDSVNVEALEVASVMTTLAGLNPAVTPDGNEEALRLTVPVKPANGTIVTLYWAEEPGTTFFDVGATLTAKSGVVDAGEEATKVL